MGKMNLIFLLVIGFFSCEKPNPPASVVLPTNLVTAINVNGSVIDVQATAENANFYTVTFIRGADSTVIETTNGSASFTCSVSGTYIVRTQANTSYTDYISKTDTVVVNVTSGSSGAPTTGYTSPLTYANYSLVWDDEFWMLGDNISSVSWPTCGEIDIMEMIGGAGANDRTVHGTVHWNENGSHAQFGNSKVLSSGRFADEFHVFSIVWNQNSITWLLDNVPYNTVDITPANMSAFHNNFFLIFNLAVGGNWPGSPDGTTVFPQKMYVDYVRVFQ